jgi:uncharacterized protein (DUF1501 family)
MLTICDHPARCGRRDFLRVGGLALGGLSLADLLAQRAAASAGSPVRDKSVIFVFLHGGPSQIETFDPKMTAPVGVRSVNGETATSLAGVTFGSAFPKLAALAHKLAIVRSFRTGDGNHDIKPVVGRETLGANLGSLLARAGGTNHPTTGMPRSVVLLPRAVDPTTQPGTRAFGRFESAGTLGAAYAPFLPGGDGDLARDMRLALPRNRLDDRRLLLAQLDRLKVSLDAGVEGADRFRAQAFTTILGSLADAFDLSKEPAKAIDRFDTAPLVRPDQINRKWNNYDNYVDNAKTLGKLLLLARRLCQAGCGFVTVTTNFVWDMHADVNNAGVEEGMRYMGAPLDYALSALLTDLEERGLSEKILVVACGEMGRTPRVNQNGGRDHWGNLAPLLLAGGGLKMGQVIGQSTRDAAEPATEPITPSHLQATIAHTVLDVGQVRLIPSLPDDVNRALTSGEPIPGLA